MISIHIRKLKLKRTIIFVLLASFSFVENAEVLIAAGSQELDGLTQKKDDAKVVKRLGKLYCCRNLGHGTKNF